MVNKPIVANIQAMNISSKPTTIIVNIAPHQSKLAAVVIISGRNKPELPLEAKVLLRELNRH
jgi:hypothetical protein